MALNKCNECGKEISDQALTCPHCGRHTEAWMIARQNKKIRTRKIWLNIISAVLIIGLVGISCCILHPLGIFLRTWKHSDEIDWVSAFEIFGCILAFGLASFIFAYKRHRIFKVISLSLFCLYFIATLIYTAIGYFNDVRPSQQFRSAYCNENVLNALDDTKLTWGDDVVISFHDNMAVFAGAINQTELPIDSVANEGAIYVKCTVAELQKIFGDRLNDYFESTKVTAQNYLDNSDKHYFTICADSFYSDFRISYVGYYANYPQTSYKPTYGYHGSYGEIADGVRISSVSYNEAGWFCLEVKLNRNRASIITSEYK